ncbi:MAG: hypothetical protein IJA61_00830 [Clostridia bacterium]|nr:hypothetical protein [Clostridia bacterium]
MGYYKYTFSWLPEDINEKFPRSAKQILDLVIQIYEEDTMRLKALVEKYKNIPYPNQISKMEQEKIPPAEFEKELERRCREHGVSYRQVDPNSQQFKPEYRDFYGANIGKTPDEIMTGMQGELAANKGAERNAYVEQTLDSLVTIFSSGKDDKVPLESMIELFTQGGMVYDALPLTLMGQLLSCVPDTKKGLLGDFKLPPKQDLMEFGLDGKLLLCVSDMLRGFTLEQLMSKEMAPEIAKKFEQIKETYQENTIETEAYKADVKEMSVASRLMAHSVNREKKQLDKKNLIDQQMATIKDMTPEELMDMSFDELSKLDPVVMKEYEKMLKLAFPAKEVIEHRDKLKEISSTIKANAKAHAEEVAIERENIDNLTPGEMQLMKADKLSNLTPEGLAYFEKKMEGLGVRIWNQYKAGVGAQMAKLVEYRKDEALAIRRKSKEELAALTPQELAAMSPDIREYVTDQINTRFESDVVIAHKDKMAKGDIAKKKALKMAGKITPYELERKHEELEAHNDDIRSKIADGLKKAREGVENFRKDLIKSKFGIESKEDLKNAKKGVKQAQKDSKKQLKYGDKVRKQEAEAWQGLTKEQLDNNSAARRSAMYLDDEIVRESVSDVNQLKEKQLTQEEYIMRVVAESIIETGQVPDNLTPEDYKTLIVATKEGNILKGISRDDKLAMVQSLLDKDPSREFSEEEAEAVTEIFTETPEERKIHDRENELEEVFNPSEEEPEM